MAIYWDIPEHQTSKSSGRKIMAVMVIILILLASGIFAIIQLFPSGGLISGSGSVRVAVIDSGFDPDVSTAGRIAAEQSFIMPQYGYNTTDPSTSDSKPDDGAGNAVPHGTLVARAILQNSPNALILVAKVIDSSGYATGSALVAAIYWAVEQNATIINLSLGTTPTYGDPLEGAIEYAFSKGVIIVSAAGNEGDNGTAGTTISSPSVYSKVISVAALDEDGNAAYYSSWGPTANRMMKPDIATAGYFETSNAIYYGTSFASPRVAAYAAELVAYCQNKGYSYTPGLIMAALFEGATPLSEPEYVVGAGQANLEQSKVIIDESMKPNGIPHVTHVDTAFLPLDFETLFKGDNYTFNIGLTTSEDTQLEVHVSGTIANVIDLPNSILIDQVGTVPIHIAIPADSGPLSGTIDFIEMYSNDSMSISIAPRDAVARIAFDISHTTWDIDTTYGQFKELYIKLTENDISVTEIRNPSVISIEYLSLFDAVFLLDPCAWDRNDTDIDNPALFSIPFAPEEIVAYEQYFQSGGGVFVTALDNDSVDLRSLNEFMSWTGAAFGNESIPGSVGVVKITDIMAHPITVGVDGFDYLGASINVNSSYEILGRFSGYTTLAAMEGSNGGRIVVTGTNFFIDNWGMKGIYSSSNDDVLALRIALWLTGLL